MKRLLVATALACALLAPPAHAGPSFQLAGTAKFVDGLVDEGGTLHAEEPVRDVPGVPLNALRS